MSERFDLLLSGGQAFTPGGLVEADIGIRGGRIAAIGALGGADAAERLDLKGLVALPGVIDTQVHFREPGLEHKEDLESGTRAAVLGGVTAIFEMPNTKPATLTAGDMADKVKRGVGRAWCDYAFFIGAADENAANLGTLELLPGCSGVKVFMGSSTGSLLVEDDELLLEVLRNGKRRVAIHAEDEPRLRERLPLAREGGPKQHPVWRDVETARKATERVLRLARKAGRRVHILHVTTADEVPLIASAHDFVTMEVTPQHLTLAAPECYERLGTLAQMNPPIREAHHREALWAAIASGQVDVIGSDHAPHTLEEKAREYPATPSGMPGVQTLLPLLLDHMNAGRLSLARLVDLTSAGAQRIYNIAGKGRLVPGYDGDVTVVDLKARRTIEKSWLASKCGWSPFEGMSVTGWPKATIIRGRVVMREDELAGPPAGETVRFLETL